MGRQIYGPTWDNMPIERREMLERGLRRIMREFEGALRHGEKASVAEREAERTLKAIAV